MQIEEAIVNALNTVNLPSDITVVLTDRDGVEPKAPYLLVQIITVANISLPTKSIDHVQGNSVVWLYQTRDFDISLTFHADTKGNTDDWVQYFQAGVFSDFVDWAFTQQGLGIVRCDDIMYQSQPVDGRGYKRAIVGMEIRAEIMNEYTVNEMNRANVTGNLDGKYGQVVVDIPFGY